MSEYLNRIAKIEQDCYQRNAFRSTGSQVVVAGPGSGKTFLLTAKVAKLILEEQVRYPQKIACITFSRQLAEKLVRELRELGVYDEERMYVGTIHAFCIAEILMPAASLLEPGILPEPFRIASEEERRKALSSALREQGKAFPENKWDRGNVESNFDKFRRRYFQPEEACFTNPVLELSEYSRNNLENLDWSKLAMDYRNLLRQNSPAMDFVQIEMLALHLLKTKPTLATTLAARYPWWFVDEYQDLSLLFHQMVMHLVQSGHISVFAIGDPNQCIYEDLQGSRPESITELSEVVRQSNQSHSIITLQKNYRSAQNLIDFSDKVLDKFNSYQSNAEHLGQIHFIKLSESRMGTLLQKMIEKWNGENSHGQIAVLTPQRDRIRNLLPTFENQNAKPDKDPDFGSNTELVQWLQKVAAWCSGEDIYFYELLPFWHSFCQPQGEGNEAQRIQTERELFNALWQFRDGNMLLQDWLATIQQTVLTQSRLDTYQQFRPDDVAEFQDLVQAASTKPKVKGKTVRSFAQKEAKILLTTFHSSKGLEFDTTIVIDLDGVRESSSAPELHKRLAYVAVSRAKSRLYLLVLNSKGKFSARLSQTSIKGFTSWTYDEQGKLRRHNSNNHPNPPAG